MSSSEGSLKMLGSIWADKFGSYEQQSELAKRLAQEKASADAAIAYQFANLHMPEDIRSRAKAWGMEAFCEVLWNNAFQAGWREHHRATVEQEPTP